MFRWSVGCVNFREMRGIERAQAIRGAEEAANQLPPLAQRHGAQPAPGLRRHALGFDRLRHRGEQHLGILDVAHDRLKAAHVFELFPHQTRQERREQFAQVAVAFEGDARAVDAPRVARADALAQRQDPRERLAQRAQRQFLAHGTSRAARGGAQQFFQRLQALLQPLLPRGFDVAAQAGEAAGVLQSMLADGPRGRGASSEAPARLIFSNQFLQ